MTVTFDDIYELQFEVEKDEQTGKYIIVGYLIAKETGDRELVYKQPFNPDTLQPFTTTQEAFGFISKMRDHVINAIKEQYGFEPDSSEPKTIELILQDEEGNILDSSNQILLHKDSKVNLIVKSNCSMMNSIIVPIYINVKGNYQQYSLVKVDIENGSGSKYITFNQTGMYEIDLNDALINGETPVKDMVENGRLTINGNDVIKIMVVE